MLEFWGFDFDIISGQLFNWTVCGPQTLASRSFVHPFVAVSNKNYDRLSHMLSLHKRQRPRGSFSNNSLEWQLGSRIENCESRISIQYR